MKEDYRNFCKIDLLSGTCGVTDVKFILGPPAREGRVTVGETHFTEQDLTRPVELRILHTEKKVFLKKIRIHSVNYNVLQCFTLKHSRMECLMELSI